MDFGELFLHFLGDEFYLLVLRESLAQNMLMIVNALRLHHTEFKWGRGEGEREGDVLSAPVSTHCIGSIIELWLSQRFGWLRKGLWVGWSYLFPMFRMAFACALRSQTLHNNVRIPLLLLVTSQAN